MRSSWSVITFSLAAAVSSIANAAPISCHTPDAVVHPHATRAIPTAADENAVPPYTSSIVGRVASSRNITFPTGRADSKRSADASFSSADAIKWARHHILRHLGRRKRPVQASPPHHVSRPHSSEPAGAPSILRRRASSAESHGRIESQTTAPTSSPSQTSSLTTTQTHTIKKFSTPSRDEFVRRRNNPSKTSSAPLWKRSGWATFPGEPAPMRRGHSSLSFPRREW